MLPRGTIVAGYRIDGVVGEGGMGVVYRATQLSLNRVVALKLLTPALGDDPGFRTRFQREGQLQAGLDHQHIVTVYEAGQTDHGLFLAMRLIAGPTLKDLILGGQLDPRRSLRILAQVAQALDEAHHAGLIHRDIKPQNILIGQGDHAYLADFGLIKAPDETSRLTGTGQFIGTIDYVAPEQIQGDPATAASDCYSLTAVLYECLTGEVPFPRPNEAATVHAHVMAPPPRVTDRRPDMPPAVDELIARGMAKDPAERPSSAAELIREATLAIASAPPAATGPGRETRVRQPPSDADRDQRTRVPAAAAALATTAAPLIASPAELTRASDVVADPAAAPPAAPTTVTPKRARTGTGAPAIVALAVALAVAVVAAGFLVGHSGHTATKVQFTSFASVGHLQLRYPSGWRLSSTPPTVPGMTFSDPVVLSVAAAHGQLDAGEVLDASGPTLLPAAFRHRVSGALPAAEPVRLGALEAYRYSGLQVRGLPGAVTVYAAPITAAAPTGAGAPSTSGVATVACWSTSPAANAFVSQCGRVAATIRLVGATALPLGPSPGYARALSTAFDRLRSAAGKPLAQLQGARTPSAQASAARTAAQAYTSAAADLGRATIPPAARDAHNAIVAALTGLARGYTSAAAAARSSDAGAYRAATRAIRAASSALAKATQSLAALGYSVGGH